MAITPTVMIASQGMLSGGGVGVNPDMTASMAAATSDPITAGIQQLRAQVTVLTNAADTVDAAALTAVLNSMPSTYLTVANTISSATAQAAAMVPNVKSFINIHSASTVFGGASMEYGAALSQFGNKSFGDLGVGVKSFTDANSGGLTSLVPGLGALAAKAKSDAFGGIGASLDPTALAKGQAQLASSSLKDGLQSVSTGLTNYGTLFDFKNPQSLSYKGLITSLQKQGLADTTGINDGISVAGYDPKAISAVPDSAIQSVLSGIQGDSLQKIIKQCSVNPVGTINSAADLVDPSNVMPQGAIVALGITPGSGIAGLQSLGNTMTNIGVPMDSTTASKLLAGVQTKVGSYLSNLTTLVPTSVSVALKPFLGSGSSPFGTPSMSDMLGSVSGVHTNDFANAGKQLGGVSASVQGKALLVAMNNTNAAINANTGIAASITALQAAVTTFNASVVGNASLAGVFASIGNSMTNITSHISLETSNLSLAGLSLGSLPSVLPGSSQILSFASKLHSFGVDKLQLGHNNIFNGAATNDLTGDAIKAALLEGKNVAAMSGVGKVPASVSNQSQALADANDSNIDSFISDFQKALGTRNQAVAAANAAKETFLDVNTRYQSNKGEVGLAAQWNSAKAVTVAALQTQMTAVDAFDQSRNNLSAAADAASNATKAKVSTVFQEAVDSLVPIIKLSKTA